MTYCIYHIPNKKIGVTRDLKYRVEQQQGYREGEYEVLEMSDDIDYVSKRELELQEKYGYKVDRKPYKDLYKPNNNSNMNINVTEQTTTFPCPVNKLKGQLLDNIGMTWQSDHGEFEISEYSIDWIMKNVQTSMYNKNRCYVYNKAFARFYDNHKICDSPGDKMEKECCVEACPNEFDLIRDWADERGLYEKGDPKTQYIKLMEEAGEVGRAILKQDQDEIVDGIGDMVVVLTNLSELIGIPIEECIERAYNVISKRTGRMVNGTFKKDE